MKTLYFTPTNTTVAEAYLEAEAAGYIAEENTEFNSLAFEEELPHALECELQNVFDNAGITGYFEIEDNE